MAAGAQLPTPEEWLILLLQTCTDKDTSQYISRNTWELVGASNPSLAAYASSDSDGAGLYWDDPSDSNANSRARSVLRGTPGKGLDLDTFGLQKIVFQYPQATLCPSEPITTWLIRHFLDRGGKVYDAKYRSGKWGELRWPADGDIAAVWNAHGGDIKGVYDALPEQPTIGDRLGKTATFWTQIAQELEKGAPVLCSPSAPPSNHHPHEDTE